MAGTQTTPGAVNSAILLNPYMIGPLSWMIASPADLVATPAPIKAIWRNEVGTAHAVAETPRA